MPNNYEHTFEHSVSFEKPSSEPHGWSFKIACDECLKEIEVRHGVDWKVTDIHFEDLDRETSTHCTWDGKCTWKCTHKVRAHYNIVHRGSPVSFIEMPIIESEIKIKYSMKNINKGLKIK